MKNVILILMFLVGFSIHGKSQISDKELQSPEIISFFNEMIQNKKVVFGQISKINENWSISADSEDNIDSFTFSNSMYELEQEDLKAGLIKMIKYLRTNENKCYEYFIIKKDIGWEFVLYDCR